MNCDYANMAIAAAGVVGAFLGAGVTYWQRGDRPQSPMHGLMG